MKVGEWHFKETLLKKNILKKSTKLQNTHIIIHNYIHIINRVMKTHSFSCIFAVENGKEERKDQDQTDSNDEHHFEQFPLSNPISHPVLSSHKEDSVESN